MINVIVITTFIGCAAAAAYIAFIRGSKLGYDRSQKDLLKDYMLDVTDTIRIIFLLHAYYPEVLTFDPRFIVSSTLDDSNGPLEVIWYNGKMMLKRYTVSGKKRFWMRINHNEVSKEESTKKKLGGIEYLYD